MLKQIKKLLGKEEKKEVDIETYKLALSAILVNTRKGPSASIKSVTISRYIGTRIGELTRDGQRRFWVMGANSENADLHYGCATSFALRRYLLRHTPPQLRAKKLKLFTKRYLAPVGASATIMHAETNEPFISVFPTPKDSQESISH